LNVVNVVLSQQGLTLNHLRLHVKDGAGNIRCVGGCGLCAPIHAARFRDDELARCAPSQFSEYGIAGNRFAAASTTDK